MRIFVLKLEAQALAAASPAFAFSAAFPADFSICSWSLIARTIFQHCSRSSGKPFPVAALIVLLPGMTLTTAMIELATRNPIAGTARLMSAVVVLLVTVNADGTVRSATSTGSNEPFDRSAAAAASKSAIVSLSVKSIVDVRPRRPAHNANERYRLQPRHASGDYCGRLSRTPLAKSIR